MFGNGADPEILILGYHKIGKPTDGAPPWYYVSVETFRLQLQQLVEVGWEVVSVDTLLGGLNARKALPPRVALVTFDDAYKLLCRSAAPILQELGLPSVVFVPVNYIGRGNDFDKGIEPSEPICDWDDLRYLQGSGMSIQSHTMSHRALSSLSAEEQLRELAESKGQLERRLHAMVRMMAYPYGDNGGDPRKAAALAQRAGYEAACVFCGGVMRRSTLDPYLLERVPISEGTDMAAISGHRDQHL